MKIAAAVAEETNFPFVTAENKFEALVSQLKEHHLPSLLFFIAQFGVAFLHTWNHFFMLEYFVLLGGT